MTHVGSQRHKKKSNFLYCACFVYFVCSCRIVHPTVIFTDYGSMECMYVCMCVEFMVVMNQN